MATAIVSVIVAIASIVCAYVLSIGSDHNPNPPMLAFTAMLILFIFYAFVGVRAIVICSSLEEDKTKVEKELREGITANAEILAEAIARNYPKLLAGDLVPCTMSREIIKGHVRNVALVRAGFGDRLVKLMGLEMSDRLMGEVSKSIRLTLAILAKKFTDAAHAQEKHQDRIDTLVRKINGVGTNPSYEEAGKLFISYEEVEKLFTAQEALDAKADETKDIFWKAHAAAKAIGEKVYPKVGWYVLLRHPGL